MPKGSVPKREAKKPKKKAHKREILDSPMIAGEAVEVVGKRRRRKAEDDFSVSDFRPFIRFRATAEEARSPDGRNREVC